MAEAAYRKELQRKKKVLVSSTNLEQTSQYAKCRDLIIVCCHATYLGDGSHHPEESDWLLEDFQRSNPRTGKPSEHETFITHIITGAFALERNPVGLLMFSGGTTTKERVRSEAEGYERVYLGLFGKVHAGIERHATEQYATDSYQNLLFSILRFRKLVGRYPEFVTVITHAFKEERFLTLHAPAIKWPVHRIRVQGINPPFTLDELRETEDGEQERGFGRFETDLYGVHEMLDSKRRARNWDPKAGEALFGDLGPEVTGLLNWDGGLTGLDIYPGRLPWEDG
jgi:hypothetical protein